VLAQGAGQTTIRGYKAALSITGRCEWGKVDGRKGAGGSSSAKTLVTEATSGGPALEIAKTGRHLRPGPIRDTAVADWQSLTEGKSGQAETAVRRLAHEARPRQQQDVIMIHKIYESAAAHFCPALSRVGLLCQCRSTSRMSSWMRWMRLPQNSSMKPDEGRSRWLEGLWAVAFAVPPWTLKCPAVETLCESTHLQPLIRTPFRSQGGKKSISLIQ
jgi:hypothetical protein